MGQLVIFLQELQNLSDAEFKSEVCRSLKSRTKFRNVEKKAGAYDVLFDISAEEYDAEGKKLDVVFSLKRGELLTADSIAFISSYWFSIPGPRPDKFYIITDSEVRQDARDLADNVGIEIWDYYELHRLLDPKFYEVRRQGTEIQLTKEEQFIAALKNTKAGKSDWAIYQKLCSDILSHLFCPPLGMPRYEKSDAEKRNRRDMIFENSNDHSYWRMLRQLYKADYIVADAKNYSELLDKQPILDLAYYLKEYGCGLFGIIVTRIGESTAATYAIKEQWINSKKMILVLNDADLIDMLKMRAIGSNPEELIKVKIGDFRMGL